MRQRRHRLQVSTFPFLAVLLCAMGSLILLLLVIDRRAKIVARVKAMRAMEQSLAQANAEDERAAAAQRAEWERRRRQLHEQLVQEEQQVRGELQGVEGKVAAAAAKVVAELANSHQLQGQLHSEQSELARFEDELSARRTDMAKTARQADLSQGNLTRLTVDLKRMEGALADLKALRQRQQQRYSLVPYRGKRGDNRRPLYLECNGDDLIFHPDHVTLHGWSLTPGGIRAEIERRLARQRSETIAMHGKPEENAYLLMLIRPNGIATYYRTLAALKGLPIEFGYEFIDQDWILDFSEGENAPKKQPWMAAEQTPQKRQSGSSAHKGQPLGPRTGRSQSLASASGRWETSPSAKSQVGALGSASGLAGASNRSEGSRAISASQDLRLGETRGGSAGTWGAHATPPATRGANAAPPADERKVWVGNGIGGPNRQGGPQNLSTTGPALGRPMGIVDTGALMPNNPWVAAGQGTGASSAKVVAGGMNSNSSPNVIGERGNSSSARATSRGGNLAMARDPARGQADPPVAPGAMREAGNSSYTAASGPHVNPDPPPASPAAQSTVPREPPLAGSPGNAGKPGIDAAPTPLPSFAPTRASGNAHPGSAASESPASPNAGGGSPAQGRPDSGEPLRGPPANPLDRFAAQNARRKPTRGVALRPGPLVGNRDWIIPIECTAGALVLPFSGRHITIVELSKGENSSNPLLETVQRMIARRQATVRPGEPPYRPMIRFRVRPDGLRAYYQAYPALEALHLPMTRENLDPEENKAAGRQR